MCDVVKSSVMQRLYWLKRLISGSIPLQPNPSGVARRGAMRCFVLLGPVETSSVKRRLYWDTGNYSGSNPGIPNFEM